MGNVKCDQIVYLRNYRWNFNEEISIQFTDKAHPGKCGGYYCRFCSYNHKKSDENIFTFNKCKDVYIYGKSDYEYLPETDQLRLTMYRPMHKDPYNLIYDRVK